MVALMGYWINLPEERRTALFQQRQEEQQKCTPKGIASVTP